MFVVRAMSLTFHTINCPDLPLMLSERVFTKSPSLLSMMGSDLFGTRSSARRIFGDPVSFARGIFHVHNPNEKRKKKHTHSLTCRQNFSLAYLSNLFQRSQQVYIASMSTYMNIYIQRTPEHARHFHESDKHAKQIRSRKCLFSATLKNTHNA